LPVVLANSSLNTASKAVVEKRAANSVESSIGTRADDAAAGIAGRGAETV
jgi:hypothetical protein